MTQKRLAAMAGVNKIQSFEPQTPISSKQAVG